MTAATDLVRQPRIRLALALLTAIGLLTGGLVAQPSIGPPAPSGVLGFEPGEDYRLADFRQLRDYFRTLDVQSERVKVFVAGHSTGGNEILLAAISSEENLRQLERVRSASQRLAAGRLGDLEARALARDGKAVVWIDNGLHASEVATSQHALLLAYELATSDAAEIRAIRDDVVLLLLPCVNPDGMNMVVDWYRTHRGTLHQDSPLPWLYQEYVGHDNNRDFFMQTQRETQVLNRLLYREWLPQILYNQHQGIWPTRMFVPPFPAPVNPNIDAAVMRGVDEVGLAIQERLHDEGRDGVVTRYGFSAWYNGSIRTVSYFHNMIGILTEVGHASATPHHYDARTFPRELAAGVPALRPSATYPRPWKGGVLRLRDAMNYMRTGSLAVLRYAARNRERLLYAVHEIARRQIAQGSSEAPFAYLIPADQHDVSAAQAFVEVLSKGAVEVHRARTSFEADGVTYAAGTHVVLLAQPFRPFVRDLIEPQRYPDLRTTPEAAPLPPYDTAGWTLSFQMGVRVVAASRRFDTSGLVPVGPVPNPPAVDTFGAGSPWGYAIGPTENAAFTAVNRLLARGVRVQRAIEPITSVEREDIPAGAWIVPLEEEETDLVRSVIGRLPLRAWPLDAPPQGPTGRVVPNRIGVYRSWVANIDEGWTRWVLEQHEFPYVTLRDRDLKRGRLDEGFHVIVLPDQDAQSMLNGHQPHDRPLRPGPWGPVPPEYQGGIGREGVEALKSFVAEGGTLVAFDQATELVLTEFGEVLSHVRDLTTGVDHRRFYCPGSVVGITVDTTHPAAWGMQADTAAFFQNSRSFSTDVPGIRSVVRYAGPGRVLLSGWLLGEPYLAGQHAVLEVPYGAGRVVLFGFRPQFRAQPHATFKLLFNLLLPVTANADSMERASARSAAEIR